MKNNLNKKNSLLLPIALFILFVVYTVLITLVDVQPIGPMGSKVGMASLNGSFANAIGIHMLWYDITNILGILAILIAIFFGVVGVMQLVTRKSLFKVDSDIIMLGIFYVVVVACYVLFDKFPINYRPVMFEEVLEPSYPSSHTMLAVCIMGTAILQLRWKMRDEFTSRIIQIVLAVLLLLTVIGRALSGVHWITDIVGGVILSAFLISLYYWFVKESSGGTSTRPVRKTRSQQFKERSR